MLYYFRIKLSLLLKDRENAPHPAKLNPWECPEDRGNVGLSGAQIWYGEDCFNCEIQKYVVRMSVLYSPQLGSPTPSQLIPYLPPLEASCLMIEVSKGVSPPLPEPHLLQSPLLHMPSSQLPWSILGAYSVYTNKKHEALSQSAP